MTESDNHNFTVLIFAEDELWQNEVLGLTPLERLCKMVEKLDGKSVVICKNECIQNITGHLKRKLSWDSFPEVTDDSSHSENRENSASLIFTNPCILTNDELKELIHDDQITYISNEASVLLIKDEKDLKKAEKKLLKSLIKPTDGWVSKNLNRPVSIAISKNLTRLNITPDLVTYITLIIGLINSVILGLGGYFPFLIGSFGFHLTSVLDGVDGELARLEYKSSERGQWLDTLCDNTIYFTSLIGLIIGIYRNNPSNMVFYSGILSGVIVLLAFMSLYLYLWRSKSGGSLVSVDYSFDKGETTFDKVMKFLSALGKRDLFALIFFLMGIFGILSYSLLYIGILGLFILAFSIHSHWKLETKG